MTPRFRFTLDGDFGSHQIMEPIGWTDIELVLERDPVYHSLVENLSAPLTFYAGVNGEDGGYEYLREALEDGGPDVKVSLEIEISEDDGATYENLFTGLLAVDDHTHIEFYKKIEVPIIRDDLWSLFIARKSQDVDLKSTEDLYGKTVTPVPDHTLTLTPQKVRQKYLAYVDQEVTFDVDGTDIYGVFDLGLVNTSEIKQKFNYPRLASPTRPAELFALEYGGDYQLDLLVTITDSLGVNQVTNLNLYVQINNDTPVAATITQQGVNGFTGTTKFTYSDSHALNPGDYIRIYFQNSSGAPNSFLMLAAHTSDFTQLQILADTVSPQTEVGAMFAFDVLKGILERITGQR